MLNITKSRFLSGKTLSLFIFLTFISFNSLFAQSGWSLLYSGASSLEWIFFTDANTGYAVGALGTIIKTTNAGLNWNTLNSGTTFFLREVFFTDANTGYVTGANLSNPDTGLVLKTTNAGLSWFALQLPIYRHMISVNFPTSNIGYVDGLGVVLKTTNAGNNWIQDTLPPPSYNYYLFTLNFINATTGYLVGNLGIILRTTNGGDNWVLQNYSGSGTLCGIYFIDSNTGVACGSSGNSNIILRTTDGGTDWSVIPFQTYSTCLLYSVRFVTPSTGWIMGWCGQILKTTDGGLNWCNQSTPFPNAYYRSCYFTSSNTGYAVSDGGFILKTTDGGGACIPVGIEPIANEVPDKFNLYQNYPNPFNPSTKITFSLPKAGNVKLVVFDLLGREVATLVNENLRPGSYEVDWNASYYSSGVYFYKLTAGEFTETKRMVLIK